MSTIKVLEEAKSVPEKIETFNKEDSNPYDIIAKKIVDKDIRHVVTVARGTSDCVAYYASGNGTSTIIFNYIVTQGHFTNDLD